MTIRERVMNAVNSADFDIDSIDKLIAIAYYMGCEESARRVCDKASAIFDEQKKRARDCRYHKMAMDIQGNVDRIYDMDYSGEITHMFGDDRTEV